MIDFSRFFTQIDSRFGLRIDSQIEYTDFSGIKLQVEKISSISAGRDNGANDFMTRAFTKPMRHRSTEEFVNNINNMRVALKIDKVPGQIQTSNLPLSMLKSTELFIGGHGADGYFETGAGNVDIDDNAEVYEDNFGAFEVLKKLKTQRTRLISIYSCYTGAGFYGASLVFKLAKLWNTPVRARTGLTICHSRPVNNSLISFEKNSTWQLATPEMAYMPAPIERPLTAKLTSFLQPNLEEIGISIDEIQNINITIFHKGAIEKKMVDKQNVASIFAAIFNSDFFINEGEVFGKITFSLVLHFKNQKNAIQIDIYCNSIAKIIDRNISFLVNENFHNYIISL
nr:hypothetical protein [uncultured Flavobacterium sp.]